MATNVYDAHERIEYPSGDKVYYGFYISWTDAHDTLCNFPSAEAREAFVAEVGRICHIETKGLLPASETRFIAAMCYLADVGHEHRAAYEAIDARLEEHLDESWDIIHVRACIMSKADSYLREPPFVMPPVNLHPFISQAVALGFGDPHADINGGDAVDLVNQFFVEVCKAYRKHHRITNEG